MGSIPRSVAGNAALELDGVNCGFVQSVAGGDVSAEVVSEPAGPEPFAKKHVGPPRYEEFELRVGLGMAKEVYDWIAATWAAKPLRKNGAIVEADATFQAQAERRFTDALLTETTIPAMDASSKEPAYLTVKFAPESIEFNRGSGKVAAPPSKQKQFISSSFRFELDGLDASRVSKVDAFTVRQTTTAEALGEERVLRREAGTLEFPNLRVTLAESAAQTWRDWFEDFVLRGRNDDGQERSGALVFLDPALKELGRVTFQNVGIFALRRQPTTSTEQVARVVAELYCEKMELKIAPIA